MDSKQSLSAHGVGFPQISYPQPQMLPTVPLYLLPGVLPMTQVNPFYNFSGMDPMMTPPFLPVPSIFNMQTNLINVMSMQAMTPLPQPNALSLTGLPTIIPTVPLPEAIRKKSSYQIYTIPSAGQQTLGNEKNRTAKNIKKPLNAFMLFNKENRNTSLEENEYDQMPILTPMVPTLEAMKTESANQIDTIPSTVQRVSLNRRQKKENYIKKPLNAFMLFIKENRKTVLEENGYDQIPAGEINKELGRRWRETSHEERQKYFELARIEKQLHKDKYPEWSAKDNYPKNPKKANKRIHDPTQHLAEMCRARFGIENKAKWCKYCLQKKKCILSREITQSYEEEITSETSRGSTETASSSATTPTDLALNQASSTPQSREESLQTSLSTNSEAEEEEKA
ncbi:hypothetical protein L3Y34_012315 [Caenorhabditis briggsae]|uniref:dTCF n=2 Tax=Caenorhabditis briggsae TaxID=6238 RepID=A0AAE8ZVE7_CAEBR|nr:hypothetical protein L3Y34_012315 [Caenorhabditis briggsae]